MTIKTTEILIKFHGRHPRRKNVHQERSIAIGVRLLMRKKSSEQRGKRINQPPFLLLVMNGHYMPASPDIKQLKQSRRGWRIHVFAS